MGTLSFGDEEGGFYSKKLYEKLSSRYGEGEVDLEKAICAANEAVQKDKQVLAPSTISMGESRIVVKKSKSIGQAGDVK